jgi:metal-responsive CopG/Arc/MetJ family transcriptional regulator
MKTVQMTLDEDLVKAVDEAARRLRTSRSAFTRRALRQALRALSVRGLEEQHRRGYEGRPVRRGEFSGWETEQRWGDE